MTFQELAHARYSVRAFQNTSIEEEKLRLILDAGRIAPTACNNQPQKNLYRQECRSQTEAIFRLPLHL